MRAGRRALEEKDRPEEWLEVGRQGMKSDSETGFGLFLSRRRPWTNLKKNGAG
jgi:hypothetical protein